MTEPCWHGLIHIPRSLALCPYVNHITLHTSMNSGGNEYHKKLVKELVRLLMQDTSMHPRYRKGDRKQWTATGVGDGQDDVQSMKLHLRKDTRLYFTFTFSVLWYHLSDVEERYRFWSCPRRVASMEDRLCCLTVTDLFNSMIQLCFYWSSLFLKPDSLDYNNIFIVIRGPHRQTAGYLFLFSGKGFLPDALLMLGEM